MNRGLNLKKKALETRIQLLEMIYRAKGGHTGGALSSVDILVALFYGVMRFQSSNPKWELRDRFILSKGHSVEGYYAILSDLGYFPNEELKSFSQYQSRLIGHPTVKVPGIEMNTGALGHGLPVAVGMALAGKMDGLKYNVYALLGDGELAEGSVWEAAMAGGHYKLDNLVGIIDRNRLQISGNTENIMGLEPLNEKWASFGWDVTEVDGHNIEILIRELKKTAAGKPRMLIADTVKGKGISFMENNPKWHHGVPDESQLKQALNELNAEILGL